MRSAKPSSHVKEKLKSKASETDGFTMISVCAWCKKNLGTVSSTDHAEYIITHGICNECATNFFAEYGVELVAFLDSLAAPVVVIDALGDVKSANRQARELLQRDLPNVEGYRPGEVFECAYSKLPGGCGRTIHCNGCTIRNTIMDTLRTGKSHLRTSACLHRGAPDDPQSIEFFISTERVEKVVLLRIDKVGSDDEAKSNDAFDSTARRK